MNVFHWFVSLFTQKGKAMSLYRSGMRLAKEHDYQAAIDEYTAAIELDGAPADVKGMALFNRGLAQMAAGNFGKSVEDLEKVVAMDDAPENVKTMARHKLVKREARQKKTYRNE